MITESILLLGAAVLMALLIRPSRHGHRRSAWVAIAGLMAGVVVVGAPGTVAAAGDVVVTVEDAAGDPIVGVQVTYDDPLAHFQSTDSNGETHWSNLDAGTVGFQVVGSWWDELGTGSVTVVDGSTAALTITADPEPALVDVEVTVEDLTGQPLADPNNTPPFAYEWYTVYVYAGENEFGYGPDFTNTWVAGDVVFPASAATLTDIPEGDRFVSVFRHDTYGARQLYAGSLTVAGDPTQATIAVPATEYGNAEISVVDQDGNTPDTYVFSTIDAPENLPWGFPDGSGGFNSPQNGVVLFENLAADDYAFSVRDDYFNDLGSATVTVTPGGTATATITITTGDVVVNVVDGSGNPITEHVTVSSSSGGDRVSVDGAGSATLFDVPTGEQAIVAYDPWGSWLTSTQVTVVQSPGGPATATLVIDPAPEYGALDVHVEDAAGIPLENMYVYPDTFAVAVYIDGQDTDAGGDAIFDPMPIGTFDVHISDYLGFSVTESVTVTAGTTTELTVIGPDAPAYGDVTVTVLDEGGDPAAGVWVYDAASLIGGFTDGLGQVTLTGLPEGLVTLEVDDHTLGTGSTTTTIVSNSTVFATIDLTAPAAGDVTVTVNDENGDPAANVYVFDDTFFFGDFTDASGQVTLTGLPEGPVTLQVDDSILGAGSTTVTIVDGTTITATIDLIAPVFVDVNITVEDTLGDPVVGIDVGIDYFFPMTTDANGVAAFTDVRTGTRPVTVFEDDTVYFEHANETLDILADPTNLTIVIPKPEYGDVKVEVVDDVSGDPVPNVLIGNGYGYVTSITGADGTATFTDLPAGYEFHIYNPIAVYDLFYNLLGDATATVDANTTTTVQIPVTTPPSGSIAVDVLDGAGGPFAGAEVHVMGPFAFGCDPTLGCDGVLVETTGAGGDVAFDPIQAGDHRIVVIANGIKIYDQDVTVNVGNQTTVSATAAFGGLDVTVTQGGQPVSGVNAVVTHSAGIETVMTNASGVAHFPLVPAGSTAIAIKTQLGTSLATGSATIAAGSTTQTAFTVTVPTPQPPKATVSAGSASTTQNPETGEFTVSMANGERQDITLGFDATCTSGSTPTAVQVFYGMSSLTPTIVGSGPGYTVTILATQLGFGGSITVEATCDGALETDELGHIVLYDPSGFVTDAITGDPVVGVDVFLYRVPGWTPRASAADDATPMTCQTNESKAPGAPWTQPAPTGEGVLEPSNSPRISPQVNPFVTDGVGYYGWDVAEGCWYITIDAPGYDSYVSPVVGVPTEVTDLDVELQPTPTVPGAPTGVAANATSSTSVGVAWTAPTNTGNSPITGYTVSTTPASAGCSTTGATTCSIAGLTPATTYTVRVVAKNVVGNSLPSSDATVTTSAVVPPVEPPVEPPVDGPDLVGVDPARLLETRPGAKPTIDDVSFGQGAVPAGTSIEVQIAGRGEVPAGATGAMLNLTAVRPVGNGYATLYPCGTVPEASSLNFAEGSNVANATFVRLSATGKVCVFVSAETQLILDVVGFAPEDSEIGSVDPARLLETRPGAKPTIDDVSFGQGAVPAGTSIEVQIAGRGEVPAGATGAMLNLTAVRPVGNGYATLYPCGTVPEASSLNFAEGSNVANATFVRLSATGKVCVFVSAETQLILDVVGFAPEDSEIGSVDPARLLETRPGAKPTIDDVSFGQGAVPAGTSIEVQIAGRGEVPAGATGAMLNLTAVRPVGNGYATLYPCGTVPEASSLNFAEGSNVANATFVRLSATGKVCVFVSAETNLILDVVGFIPPV